MPTLLVATTNPGKIAEILPLLRDVPFDLMTLAAFADISAPDETGRTFAENAREKALYYARRTGRLTVAEDSGLEVDALHGAPGVLSARYAGVNASYPEKFAQLYAELARADAIESSARFVCALAVVRGTDVVFEAEGVVDGRIAPEPRGTDGFGYDPIFFYPPFGQTLAEAGERKASVSHRARAFRALRSFLLAQGSALGDDGSGLGDDGFGL